MKRIIIALIIFLLAVIPNLYASQSTITEAEGYACMGDDKSKKDTEQAALSDAKRKAVDYTLTYLESNTEVKNFVLESDMVKAYSNASVRVIQEIEKGWFRDPSSGECFRLKVKAEVTPDEKKIKSAAKEASFDDPTSLLNVRVWTDKKEYKNSEKIKVYIRGNKPFYARVVYKDAAGKTVQLFPNPYSSDNYFKGGTVYEIPSGEDRFDLEVSPPFGSESITVYAGSSQLGDLDLESASGIYDIKTKPADIGVKTRGVKIKQKEDDGGKKIPVEFSETSVSLVTKK
ncbi:MAG: DUF4384 domain-containing protein [Desulfobacteraceae bacterium]|nr:MAG: DUF4384 domain-containing protein [Desulfobacteraceae bacterium]